MRLSSTPRLRGVVTTPGDKSISHRALMLSALAKGQSVVKGASSGEDVVATATILQQLGAVISHSGQIEVSGPTDGLRASHATLDCGNSGTTIRLLMGLLAGVAGIHNLDGDSSLRRRPMDRVAYPLELMGMNFSHDSESLYAPFQMTTDGHPLGINYVVPVPSAQVKSAVLLAGLFAESPTTVTESTLTRSNTEEMLIAAGLSLAISVDERGRSILLEPGRPEAREWFVPQDPSQAAFFVVAATIHPDADLEFRSIYAGAERIGFLNVLDRMGANIHRNVSDNILDLRVQSSTLSGTDIHSSEIPSVDEVPILVVAAAAATGTTVFMDMAELRLKESDRFANSVALAQALGAHVEIDRDSFSVTGIGGSRGFLVPSSSHQGDHRMTMATAIAGICGNGADIEYPESTKSSFPNFFELLSSLSL